MTDETTTPTEPAGALPAPFGDPTGRLEHVNTLRNMIARHAGADEERFYRLLAAYDAGQTATDEEHAALRAAHHAALYGYGLAAVLRWVFEQYGVGAVFDVARVVEEIAEDGGEEPGELTTAALNLCSLFTGRRGGATYRKRPIEVQAIQFTGGNVTEIWDAFGTDGIYGPTETNPDHLILTTTHGDPAPARPGDWVVPDSKPGTFYPIKPDVFEATYEPAVAESSPPPDDICGAALRGGDRVWCCDLPVGHGSTTLHRSGSGTYWGDSGPEAVDRG